LAILCLHDRFQRVTDTATLHSVLSADIRSLDITSRVFIFSTRRIGVEPSAEIFERLHLL